MKNLPPSNPPRRQQGVALVIVLCFVVLITGLVVAYFSRTLTTRRLSNASTSTTSAAMLADSATDVILSGLKQEIADPTASTASTPPPGAPSTTGTLYFPTQAGYAVPQRNAAPAATPATAPAPAVGPIPNLVRRSLRLDVAPGGTNAVPTPGVTSRASAASSDRMSVNGRSVSTARWNRHYLIPTDPLASPPPSLDASKPVADFTAPDWVFVTAEKGPVVLSGPNTDASGTVTVTGRYAYAIYDEGGLLDINHTGYPSASTLGHIGAKAVPSYADLTQLGMTTANVDNLLGWRNYATLQATSTFPTLQPPSNSATDTAYYNLFVSNPNSLLQVPLTLYNGKTDQMFLSRQQLIGYFTAVGLDPKYLQYFGTFSRSLNQPSYLPEHSSLALDPIRPLVRAAAAGGNDAAGVTGITPNFLTARVVNAFAPPDTRYDGTPVVIGEPLVKKRFPLNRLAWLTYKGPSSNRNLNDPDMAALIAKGITADFLAKGTPANVELYFGLRWDATAKWTYVHSNTTILNVSNPAKPTDVARLSPGREPDFFELLKASINPGSIAKTSLSPSVSPQNVTSTHTSPGNIDAATQQYNLDSSTDAALMQIGANIIDQFDTDSFPTRISYNFANASGVVYGDENLPYISRVRAGLIRLKEASPSETDVSLTGPDSGSPDTRPIVNTGVGVLMNFPEIWNPHDWSVGNAAQSFGAVGPSQFKIFATTNKYNLTYQTTSVYAWARSYPSPNGNAASNNNSFDANPDKSPGFANPYQFLFGLPGSQNKGGEPRILTENNTRMTFTIDPTNPTTSGLLFREPTILYRPGLPYGSQLASSALVSSNFGTDPAGTDGLGHLANDSTFFGPSSSGGLISDATGTVRDVSDFNQPYLPQQSLVYVGIYLGAHPLRWWTDQTTPPQSVAVYQSQYGPVNDITYILACKDDSGVWLPYDTKAVTSTGSPDGYLHTGQDAGFGLNGTVGNGKSLDYGLRYYETVDPRTSRFGMMDPWIQSNATSIPPREGDSSVPAISATSAVGAMKTDREGVNAGTAFYYFPFTGGDYAAGDWHSAAMGWYHDADMSNDSSFRPGMLSQNNPHVTPDGAIIITGQALPAGSNVSGTFSPFYYADADGVVRRASAGNVPGGTGVPASFPPGPPNSLLPGLPMAYTKGTLNTAYSSGATARQMDSRPVILNRPFRSVAELGYVYSGTPWKNLDFFLPESGDAAMLDVFCVNDNSDASAMSAGQVNLNTHQVPVLQAILAQANKDQWNDASTSQIPANATILGTPSSAQAQQIAQLLVTRTVTGPAGTNVAQPLQNVSDLVGRWVKEVDLPSSAIDGQASCDGFTADLANLTASPDPTHNIQRFAEGAIRALANAGQTRVWNLMFDIVAQTGRYPKQATTLDQFNVEGEQHYWVHVAIDRYTGQILDKQVEVVKE